MDQEPNGKRILEMGDSIEAYLENLPQGFGKEEGAELAIVLEKINQMSKTVPCDFPKKCPNAI